MNGLIRNGKWALGGFAPLTTGRAALAAAILALAAPAAMADTVTYNIGVSGLINQPADCCEAGDQRYNNCVGEIGWTWTDTLSVGATVTAVDITIHSGIECNGQSYGTVLNGGFPGASYFAPFACDCCAGTTPDTAAQDPAGYVVGGSNTVVTSGVNNCSGTSPIDGAYAVVTVTFDPPPPPNDLCQNAILVTVPSQTHGTTTNATVDSSFPACGTSITAPGVWYRVIGTGNTMTATTCVQQFYYDTKLSVFCNGCETATCITGNDDNCVAVHGLLSTVNWCSVLGAEYLILVHGFSSQSGNFDLAVTDNGSPCTGGVQCAVQTGACCGPGDGCTDGSTEADCASAGGSWFEGQECGSDPCPPTGACCVPGDQSTCFDEATEGECSQAGGTWFEGQPCANPSAHGLAVENEATAVSDRRGVRTLQLDPTRIDRRGGLRPFGQQQGVQCEPEEVVLGLDILNGVCPNPFNRRSGGFLPVYLSGESGFDPDDVDTSTLQLSRADGVGGTVAPSNGPPGPNFGTQDIVTHFLREECECGPRGTDRIPDLGMRFDRGAMTSAFLLDSEPRGSMIQLELRGTMNDDTAFVARDCIQLLP